LRGPDSSHVVIFGGNGKAFPVLAFVFGSRKYKCKNGLFVLLFSFRTFDTLVGCDARLYTATSKESVFIIFMTVTTSLMREPF
jgi:hypothetical protein